MEPFLALITPMGGGGSGAPPGIWAPAFPTNPIARPPWGWGSDNPPAGWYPHPSHPIWYPGLGFWGGRLGDYIDAGFPGPQPPQQPPGSPGAPTHPIWGPPGFNPPGPGMPPGIWGGRPPLYVDIGFPGPQPELPPDLPPVLPDQRPVEWKVAWTPTTGWVVVGIPTGPTPTPSAAPTQTK